MRRMDGTNFFGFWACLETDPVHNHIFFANIEITDDGRCMVPAHMTRRRQLRVKP